MADFLSNQYEATERTAVTSTSIGLSFKQLQVVFPFHVRINSNFIITQVGSQLKKLFVENEVTKEPVCIGERIDDIFKIVSPTRLKWDYKILKVHQNTTFSFDVKDTNHISIERLPLVGGILISDPKTDPSYNELGAIFLLNLNISTTTELLDLKLSFSHLNRFGFQKDLMLAKEHLQTELNLSSKLEKAQKIIKQEKSKTMALLETKRYFVRYVSHEIRTPLNILVTGLKYFKEIITPWYEKIKSMKNCDDQSISIPSVAITAINDGANGSSNDYVNDYTDYVNDKTDCANDNNDVTNGNNNDYVNDKTDCANDNNDGNNDDYVNDKTDCANDTNNNVIEASVIDNSFVIEEMKEIESALTDMMQASSVAVDILNDLIMYEKIEANLLKLQLEEVNARGLVFNIANLFNLQALSKDISVFLDLESISNIYIKADISKFSQVVRNLMSNALKFTPPGGCIHVIADILVKDESTDTFVLLSEASQQTREDAEVESVKDDHVLESLSSKSGYHLKEINELDVHRLSFSELSTRLENTLDNMPITPREDELAITNNMSKLQINTDINRDSSIITSDNDIHTNSPLNNNNNLNDSSCIMEDEISSPQHSVINNQDIFVESSDDLYSETPITSLLSRVLTSKFPSKTLKFEGSSGTNKSNKKRRPSLTPNTSIYVDKSVTGSGKREYKYKIRISIKDTGRGISLEDQATLFQEFMQVRANKSHDGCGSGLGLWVSKKIVEAHSGSIHVYSEGEIDHGTTFSFDLPISGVRDLNLSIDTDHVFEYDKITNDIDLTKSPSNDTLFGSLNSPASRLPKDEISQTENVSNRTIDTMLIVDDSAINRKMMKRLFTGKCGLFEEAVHGKDGIQKVNDYYKRTKTCHDVIMMDYTMPIMNGPDCVRELRRQGYQGLIIGVTGNSQQSDIDIFTKAGINRVMFKPLDSTKFIQYVIAWLNRKDKDLKKTENDFKKAVHDLKKVEKNDQKKPL